MRAATADVTGQVRRVSRPPREPAADGRGEEEVRDAQRNKEGAGAWVGEAALDAPGTVR